MLGCGEGDEYRNNPIEEDMRYTTPRHVVVIFVLVHGMLMGEQGIVKGEERRQCPINQNCESMP
jgi:hypothetical protein